MVTDGGVNIGFLVCLTDQREKPMGKVYISLYIHNEK
jgi:hypothetical protein